MPSLLLLLPLYPCHARHPLQVHQFNYLCSHALKSSRRVGSRAGWGAWKCKAKPKPHTILRHPSITTGRKDKAGDKAEEQEQGEALKSHCNQQVSKVELLSPLLMLGSG